MIMEANRAGSMAAELEQKKPDPEGSGVGSDLFWTDWLWLSVVERFARVGHEAPLGRDRHLELIERVAVHDQARGEAHRAIQLGFSVQYFRFDELLAAPRVDAHLPPTRIKSRKYMSSSLLLVARCASIR